MVAPSMRSDVRDSVLITLAVAVTVLAWWPRFGARQLVQVHCDAGNTAAYAIPLDDPRLDELRQQIFNAAHPGPRTEWALARWRHRLATHYIEHPAASQHGTAARRSPAAITDVSSGARPTGSAASHQHWVRKATRAERTIRTEQRQLARQRAAADAPPVVLGRVTPGPRRPGAWLAALAGGLLAALGFAHWRHRWPAVGAIRGRVVSRRRGASAGEPSAETEALSSSIVPAAGGEAVRVEIPAQWVRIHQPWPVALRRWATALVVTAALGSHWLAG